MVPIVLLLALCILAVCAMEARSDWIMMPILVLGLLFLASIAPYVDELTFEVVGVLSLGIVGYLWGEIIDPLRHLRK